MGTYEGAAGSRGRAFPELVAGLVGCWASGSSSKMAFLIRSMKGIGHVLTSSVLLALPRSTPRHHSEAQHDRTYSTKSVHYPPALYPIDKRTLAFYMGYAAIVDCPSLLFNQEI